jgi:uncharacterized protein
VGHAALAWNLTSSDASDSFSLLFRRDIQVKIRVRDVEAAAKELHFEEPTTELSRLLAEPVEDFRLPQPLLVSVTYYRAGTDLFFQGRIAGEVIGHCSRCLEEYSFPLALSFTFVVAPHSERGQGRKLADEGDLAYYEGEEVDLSPLLRERVLLSLPTRPLCRQDCQGLCPQCGAKRGDGGCGCESEGFDKLDPRLAMLREIKVRSRD